MIRIVDAKVTAWVRPGLGTSWARVELLDSDGRTIYATVGVREDAPVFAFNVRRLGTRRRMAYGSRLRAAAELAACWFVTNEIATSAGAVAS